MFKNLSAKNKTLVLTVGSLIVFSLILLGIIYINQKNKLGQLEKSYANNIKSSYQKVLDKHKSFYEFRLRANIRSKGVKEAFAAKNRDELLSLVEGRWEVLKNENQYLKLMHFHLPNGESFLRVHRKEKYGDNIAKRRPMAEAMHKLQKPLFGFEAGIYMLAYRTFIPIFYKDNYIGAVEFGSRPDQILHEMDYFNNIKGALFVKDDKIIEYKEKSDLMVGEYKLQYSTLKDQSILNYLPKDFKLEDDTSIKVNDKYYSIYVFNLTDYDGKTTAKAVFFHDISSMKNAFKDTVKQLILLLVGLMGLIVTVISFGFSSIINKLDETNKKLNENKNFINSILKNSAHAIIATDSKGTITLFNKKAEQLLGYKASDLIGKETPAVFHKESEVLSRAKEFSKEYGVEIEPGFDVFVTKTEIGIENNDEWTYINKEKKEFPVSLHITKLIDEDKTLTGYLGMAEDISIKKAKDKKIQEYLRLIDKNIITSSTDLEGNITYVSEAFCQISGYSKDELMGKNHSIIRHPDMNDSIYKELWETIISDKTWTGEIKNLKKDNSYYWVKASISPIFDKSGEKIGYTAIRQDITDKKLIELISITDGLTNIFNRRHFNEVFPKVINSAKRKNDLVSFLIMDIDHFKQYNDTYGHQMGDDVLIRVADAIKNSLHRADDICFRLGGEEFGVIFKTESIEKAQQFANTIRENIENLHIQHSGNSASSYVTASMGLICKNANDIKSDDEVYKQGDDLLYKAKRSGRNKVVANKD